MASLFPSLKITSLDFTTPAGIGETAKITAKVENTAFIPKRALITITDKRPDGTSIKTSFGPGPLIRGSMTLTGNFVMEGEGLHTITAEVSSVPFARAPTVEDTLSKQIQVIRSIPAGNQGANAGFMGGAPPIQQSVNFTFGGTQIPPPSPSSIPPGFSLPFTIFGNHLSCPNCGG